MPKVYDLLKNHYAAWRSELPASWKTPLKTVDPDLVGVPTKETVGATVPIIPRLKSDPIPGGPPGAGALRALDRVAFPKVRVVLMGQDPYPRKRQATGRAFEPGSWVSWDATGLAAVPASFQKFIQRLAEHRTGDAKYLANWSNVTADVNSGALTLPSPTQLFDAWEDQGVMFLNKVLTYTKPAHVQTHHGVFWRPIIHRIIEKVVSRSGKHVVFALWGKQSQALTPIIQAATPASAWNTSVKVVAGYHPSTDLFFTGPNQFKAINDALSGIQGAAKINW